MGWEERSAKVEEGSIREDCSWKRLSSPLGFHRTHGEISQAIPWLFSLACYASDRLAWLLGDAATAMESVAISG